LVRQGKHSYLDEPAAPAPDLALTLRGRVLALVMIVVIVAVGFYPTV
jgi:hypothetical protein